MYDHYTQLIKCLEIAMAMDMTMNTRLFYKKTIILPEPQNNVYRELSIQNNRVDISRT